MADQAEPRYVDSSRLKQVNLELGHLAGKHKACRVNSGLFSGLGAVVLALSLLGLIHIFPAGADDWTQNPASPVYAIAVQQEDHFTLKAVLVGIGFFTGLAFVYTARRQCVKQRSLWQREGDLRKEMRELRDRLQRECFADHRAVVVATGHSARDVFGFLAEAGVTRASVGVQDLTPKVQEAIHRIQQRARGHLLARGDGGLGRLHRDAGERGRDDVAAGDLVEVTVGRLAVAAVRRYVSGIAACFAPRVLPDEGVRPARE